MDRKGRQPPNIIHATPSIDLNPAIPAMHAGSEVAGNPGYVMDVVTALDCPSGTFITGVFGAAGDLIDSVGITCSNNVGSPGVHGGDGGNPYSYDCAAGFTSVQASGSRPGSAHGRHAWRGRQHDMPA